MDTEPQKHDFTVTRIFDAPVERVWKAWSDPEQVKRWWGPDGFTAPLVRIDFREGGTTLVCMRSPDGRDFYNNWTYHKIIPLRRIEFTSTLAGQDGRNILPAQAGLPAEIPAEVPHLVTFTALGPNRTKLSVTEYGYPTQQIASFSRSGQEQVLEKMAASIAREGSASP